jgi:hypothetical protein
MTMSYSVRSAASVLAIIGATAGGAQANDDVIRGIFGLGTAIMLNGAAQRQAEQRQYRRVDPGYQRPGNQRRDDRRAEMAAARMEIQRRLNVLGFDAGVPDGVYGGQTRDAIARFQASIGANASGKISQSEIAALYQQSDAVMAGGGAPSFDGFAPAGTAQANQFPVIGAPPQGQDGEPARSFPAMRSSAKMGGPAFPSLTSSGGPEQSGTDFPALGRQAAPTNAPASYPAFNSPAAAKQGSGFPTLGQPGAPATTAATAFAPLEKGEGREQAPSAFPTLDPSEANRPLSSDMPELASAPEHAAEVEITLASELQHTPFKTIEDQPAILDIRLGTTFVDAEAKLKAEGFTSCGQGNSSLDCSRQSDALIDKVRLWKSGDGTIFGLTRTIEFKTPVPSAPIREQFNQNYRLVMESSHATVVSKAECDIASVNFDRVVQHLDTVHAAENENRAEIVPATLAATRSCPIGYHIAFAEKDGLTSAVRIAFFDGTSVLRQAQRKEAARLKAAQEQQQKEESDRKLNLERVSSELKL